MPGAQRRRQFDWDRERNTYLVPDRAARDAAADTVWALDNASHAAVLAVSAFAATFVPARRAASVNPIEALRVE